MNRKKILEVVKGLDESGVYPYLHDVLTDGSATSENWLNDLEERDRTRQCPCGNEDCVKHRIRICVHYLWHDNCYII